MVGVRFIRGSAAAVFSLTLVAGVLATSASAGSIAQGSIVSANPADQTPNLLPDPSLSSTAAYAIESANGLIYIGGRFAKVQNAARTVTYNRSSFVAFDPATGAVSALAPSFNGDVWAIRALGNALYVGGTFTAVNGVARRGLVKIDATTGAVDQSFAPPWSSGTVTDMQIVGGRLIVGGTFSKALRALNLSTGADTGFLSGVGVAGNCYQNAACEQGSTTGIVGSPHVYRFAVSADGTRLVAIGNFIAPHPRAFMVDMTTGNVAPWYYAPLAHRCRASGAYPAYLRDVDFSPDGSYFVIASTGYITADASRIGMDVCDAAARFETNIANPFRPTWINYTGGDTLHSVVVTGAAVYVNGHNRWLDNPFGADSCVGTCVSRPGIGAIDPITGRAMSWNPTKDRGVGGKDLLATSQGIWVASDTAHIGHEYHYGVALMPLI